MVTRMDPRFAHQTPRIIYQRRAMFACSPIALGRSGSQSAPLLQASPTILFLPLLLPYQAGRICFPKRGLQKLHVAKCSRRSSATVPSFERQSIPAGIRNASSHSYKDERLPNAKQKAMYIVLLVTHHIYFLPTSASPIHI